jgi:hypothetical protein
VEVPIAWNGSIYHAGQGICPITCMNFGGWYRFWDIFAVVLYKIILSTKVNPIYSVYCAE